MSETRRTLEEGTIYPEPPTYPKPKSGEGSEWFWRIFGGTILGAITFLLITLLNSLNSNIETIRTDHTTWQKEVNEKVGALENQSATVNEAINSVKESLKEKNSAIEQDREFNKERKAMVDDQIKVLQEQIKSIEAEIKELRDTVVSSAVAIQNKE